MKKGSKIAGGNPERGRVDNDYYATHPDSTKAFLIARCLLCGSQYFVSG